MRKNLRKLVLNRETLTHLNRAEQVKLVRGGVVTEGVGCMNPTEICNHTEMCTYPGCWNEN